MRLSTYYNIVLSYGSDILTSQQMLLNKNYIQHGDISIYYHCISVALIGLWLCDHLKIKVNKKSLVRGALLHDYFLYDWHIKQGRKKLHGFRHPYIAYDNANKQYDLDNIEKDIIIKHMFPLTLIPPRYKESYIICLADKIAAVNETCKNSLLDEKVINSLTE